MEFIKYSDNFYYSTFEEKTDQPTIGYYKGENISLMLDAGNGQENFEKFLGFLKENNLKEPDFILITHSHWDHTFGLKNVKIPSIALQDTYDRLKAMQSWKWNKEDMWKRVESGEDSEFSYHNILHVYPDLSQIKVELPTMTFHDHMTIHLGNQTCQLQHVPSAHDSDCCLFHFVEDGILFFGDAYSSVPIGDEWVYDKEKLGVFIDYLKKHYDSRTVCIKGHHVIQTLPDMIEELTSEYNKL